MYPHRPASVLVALNPMLCGTTCPPFCDAHNITIRIQVSRCCAPGFCTRCLQNFDSRSYDISVNFIKVVYMKADLQRCCDWSFWDS